METTFLIYNILVLLISLLVFNLKITFYGEILEFFAKILMKLITLFCMIYSGIQIFKHFKII